MSDKFINFLINKHAYMLNHHLFNKDDYLSACNHATYKAKKQFREDFKVKFNTFAYYKYRREIDNLNRQLTKEKNNVKYHDLHEQFHWDNTVENYDIMNTFNNAVSEFDYESKELIIGKLIHKKTYKELSKTLGYSTTTLGKRWKNIKPKLQEKMSEQ